MSQFKDCTPIYNAFGIDYLNKLPVLDIENKMGGTGYIDFIMVDDMTHPIMKGYDCYGRPFLSMKVLVKNEDDPNYEKHIVGTFFQRFSSSTTQWAFGTFYDIGMIYNDSRVRFNDYESLEKRLKLLFIGGTVKNYDWKEKKNAVLGNGKYIIKFDLDEETENVQDIDQVVKINEVSI